MFRTLKELVLGPPDSTKNVKLLLKIKRLDGSDEEEVVIVHEHEVTDTCERFAHAEDVLEVWAYRQFFHRKKETPVSEIDPADFIPVVAAMRAR